MDHLQGRKLGPFNLTMKNRIILSFIGICLTIFSYAQDEKPATRTPESPTVEDIKTDIPDDVNKEQVKDILNQTEESDTSTKEDSQTEPTDVNETEDDLEKIQEREKALDTNKGRSQSFNKVNIFGHDYLRGNDFSYYNQTDDVKVRGDYILGPNDEITISVWGDTQVVTDNFTIDKDGSIDFSGEVSENGKTRYGFGRIFIGGLTYDEATELLEKKYTRFFNFKIQDFKVKVNGVREINIDIIGDVELPGMYRVSAVNTAYNVLKISGGPTTNGSARAIQIKRDGKTIQTLDVYKYLIDGESQQNIYLKENDVIFIPPIHKLVEIQGSIRKPTRYEMLPNEVFADLLHYSGGFLPNALKSRFQVFRYENDDYVLRDYSFNVDNPKQYEGDLVDGDLISIKSIPAVISNIVTASGALNQTGEYEFERGMRVLDLINHSNGLRFDAVKERAYITRLDEDLNVINIAIDLNELLNNPESEHNHLLYPQDELEIMSKKDFSETFKVNLFGQVNKPGSYTFGSSLTLQDLLIKAGGFKSDAFTNEIELRRVVDYSEEEGRQVPILSTIKKFNVDYKFLNPENQNNKIELRPYDQIFVRSIPEFEVPTTISIVGEVELPGAYPLLRKDMRVTELIELAGGFTPFAYKEAAKFYRRDGQLYLIDVNEISRRPSSKYNYVLQPGDRLQIPTIDETITIAGAIRSKIDNSSKVKEYLQQAKINPDSLALNPTATSDYLKNTPGVINTAFRGNKTAKWYIDEFAAGYDKGAWKRTTQVIYPNGKVNGTRKFLFFNVYPEVIPGSEILVEFKPKKPENKEGFFRDLSAEKTIALVTSAATTTALILAITRNN